MTSLSKLSASIITPDATAQSHAGKTVSNTQSKKGFTRKILHSKDLLTFQSSNGGSVQINISELWALAESNDPLLCVPKPAIPVATPPAT